MFRNLILLTFIVLFFSHLYAGTRCGTVKAVALAKAANFENCRQGALNVLERRTEHFVIYYTDQGVHAIKTPLYIDSLAKYLEDAYYLHKNVLGMGDIRGKSQTLHYQKTVPLGFYPVEVVDTGMLRGYEGDYAETYGLIPPPLNSQSTQIVIENDFLYGADCLGNTSTKPFISGATGHNYSEPDKWHLALKVTTYHELYHSFQIYQIKYLTDKNIFWAEASATGVEEIGAPKVNDYINYLSVGLPRTIVDSDAGYDWASLYLFLHSELGPEFDAAIWKSFAANPRDGFAMQLARHAYLLEKNVEDLFHKYAAFMFFSGKRAPFLPDSLSLQPTATIMDDLPAWPEWRVRQTDPWVLPAGSFYFLDNTNYTVPRSDSVARLSSFDYGDSSVWVLSRLLAKNYIPPVHESKELIAYPNPWNPMKNPSLYFRNSKGVEIRSSTGALIAKLKSEGDTLIWQPPKIPAPGILYYRTLPNGKTKVLIVEY